MSKKGGRPKKDNYANFHISNQFKIPIAIAATSILNSNHQGQQEIILSPRIAITASIFFHP